MYVWMFNTNPLSSLSFYLDPQFTFPTHTQQILLDIKGFVDSNAEVSLADQFDLSFDQ